jgi:hypothetical protein
VNDTSVISSGVASDATAAGSSEVWDDADLDETDMNDFLYDALCNEHPADADVDLDALAAC